jgi:TPP-dependent indolepyruvate ferredoxin oxidoreductase alpha subunit
MKNCELKQRDDANIARGWKERERERKRIDFEESQKKSKQISVKNTSAKARSVFSALEESSSDEESTPAPVIKKETKKSYSEMAATVKEEPAPIVEEEIKEELAAPVVPKKKSILERLREPMPAPAAKAPAPKKDKEAIRLARKEVIAKYKAQGKQVPWAIYDEYNTDSDSEDESD